MNGIKYKDSSLDTTNLIDYSTWTVGQSSATGFARIGYEYENLIVSDFCPHGEIGPIWQAFNSDVDSNADGGWNISPSIDIDNSKTYRFSVWWKNVANATTNADGTFYHGVYGYNSSGANVGVYNRSNGAVNTNAYFYYPYVRELEEGTWYLTVGHIFPAGSGTGPRHEDSGLYTKYGGKNSSVATLDFTWHENGSKVTYRSYYYNSNNPASIVQFAYPRIEIVDGTEPTINQLLNGFGGYPVAGATQDRNFYVKTSGDMGPSEKTHYWSMIPVSGTQYALYGFDESVNKPRITVDPDSQSFITRINNLTEESITTISEAISWVDSNSKAHVDFNTSYTTTTTTATPTTTTTTTTDPYDHVYIDPSSATNGVGTIEDPKNTFTGLSLQDDTKYHIKRDETLVSSTVIDLSGRTNTIITDYGTGDIPKFRSTATGTCAIRFALSTSCTVENLEVYTDLSNSLVTLIQMGTGTGVDGGTSNVISNCFIHHVKQGTADGGMGIRGGGTSLSIINTKIEDCGCDGIYMHTTPSILIDGCEIRRINQNYAGAAVGFNSLGNSASGDGIQLDGVWSNYIIRNTIVDRSDAYTGNKYCVIVNHAEQYGNDDSGIIENCTFSTNSNVPAAVHIEFGNQSIIRYNWFNGLMNGIRLGGVYCVGIKIHHNIFVGCQDGIGVGTSYSGAGYAFTGPATLTEIYNNVFYNVRRYHTWHDNAAASCDFKNNIHLRTTDSGVAIYTYGAANNWTKSNNCYGSAATAGTPGTGTNPQIGDPGFVDAANGDFHLQLTSICRNAGIDVNIDEDFDGVAIPQETYPAIGAYEYI